MMQARKALKHPTVEKCVMLPHEFVLQVNGMRHLSYKKIETEKKAE